MMSTASTMTRTSLRRRVAALAVLLTALAALAPSVAPPAAAAPAVRDDAFYSAVTDVEVPLPTAGLAVFDAYLGTGRGVVVLYDGGRTRALAETREDFAVTVTPDDVTGSGPLYDSVTGEPLGTAAYDLDIARTDTEVERVRRGTGNDAARETRTVTQLRVTGTLTVLAESAEVNATGLEVRYDFFDNAPEAEVGLDASGQLSAVVPGEDGQVLLLEAGSDEFSAVVLDAQGAAKAALQGLEGTRVLHEDGLHGTVLVQDLSEVEPTERTIDVPGQLDRAKVRTVEPRPHGDVHLTTQGLTLQGMLEIAPGSSFDLSGVRGVWTHYRWVYQHAAL